MLRSLATSRNYLKITQDEFGQPNSLDIPIQISGDDRIQIIDNIYDLTPEIYKALSWTSYNGKTMKDEKDILMMSNIINDLGCTSRGDKSSKRQTFFTITLPEWVEKIQKKTFNEITDSSDDLQGKGVNIIIPSNIIDIYTRLETLLGLKISGHLNTLAEAGNLIDEFHKRWNTNWTTISKCSWQIFCLLNGASG